MSKFKVGDKVLVINAVQWEEAEFRYMIGVETIILDGARMLGGYMRYPCHDPVHPETGPFWIRAENLRRLDDPSSDCNQLTTWDDVGVWRPAKVSA